MYKFLLIFLLATPALMSAQLSKRAPRQMAHERRRNFNDSVVFYKYLLKTMRTDAQVKLQRSDLYQSIQDTMLAVRRRSTNYTGLVLFGEAAFWNIDGLNKQLDQMSFPKIPSNPNPRVGFGISSKKKRRMFDLQVLVFGSTAESRKGDEKMKHSFHSYLNFTWGYDLLKSDQWSIYPFAGIGRRKTMLIYSKPVTYNSNNPSIPDLIDENRNVTLRVDRLSYLAGIEADFDAGRRPYAKNIFFLRFGLNGPFRKEYYGIGGARFDTGMLETVWTLTVGLKLAVKN